MEDFLVFLIMILFVVMLARVSRATLDQPPKKKDECPPHKWTYDATDRMFCDICKRAPGQIGTDYDKPY